MVIVRNDNKPVKYFARVRKVGSLFVRFEVGIETTVHREVCLSFLRLREEFLLMNGFLNFSGHHVVGNIVQPCCILANVNLPSGRQSLRRCHWRWSREHYYHELGSFFDFLRLRICKNFQVRDLFHHKLYTFIEQSRLVLDDPIGCLLKVIDCWLID